MIERNIKMVSEMEYSSSYNVVVVLDRAKVAVMGNAGDTQSFWQSKCFGCAANPDSDGYVPDIFNARDDVTIVCAPIRGFRNCAKK